MEKSPVISIIGGTIWGNRGAEAMLVTTIGGIREFSPEAHFNVFSYYPAKDCQLVADSSVTILSGKPASLVTRHFLGALLAVIFKIIGLKIPGNSFFKIARAFSDSDLLLDIGGITFSDGREKYLPFNILSIWPAMLLNVPVVKMAQAVGPFEKPVNRTLAKIFLTRCEKIFARGDKTAEFLKLFNYPESKYDTVADIAFLYQSEYSLSSENDQKITHHVSLIENVKKQGKQIIVFSPSILVDQESKKRGLDYADRFLELIKTLGTQDFHYIFMPNATREGSDKSHNNDLLTLTRMREAYEITQAQSPVGAGIEWVDYDINTASVRRIISQADVLVTSRYHAMISGLSLGVPTVVIGWGHKYKETMAYFNLGEYSFDFGGESMDLPAIILKILGDAKGVREKINVNLPEVKRLAQKQFDYLKRVLL